MHVICKYQNWPDLTSDIRVVTRHKIHQRSCKVQRLVILCDHIGNSCIYPEQQQQQQRDDYNMLRDIFVHLPSTRINSIAQANTVNDGYLVDNCCWILGSPAFSRKIKFILFVSQMMLSFMTDDQGIWDKSTWYNKHDLNIPLKLILFNRLLKSEVYFGHFHLLLKYFLSALNIV